MINFKKLAFAGVMGALMLGEAALASTYVIDNEATGYVSSGGNFTGIRPNTNYLVGLCNASNCRNSPGEYRDYFYFAIPTLDGPIASVTLDIPTRNVSLNQSPTVTYQVTSLGIEKEALGVGHFNDLGTGILYASREYSAEDAQITHNIALSAAAISALGGGWF